MKRMSQIASELRAKGRMFSQTRLNADLACFTPVFKEGKVIFYEDVVTDQLMSMYKVRFNHEGTNPPVVEPEPSYSRLERIEKMLENISGYLALTVPG